MKTKQIICSYQNYIEAPPVPAQRLYQSACDNDDVTINSWRMTWVRNIKANKKTYENFGNHSIGEFFNKDKNKPVIIIGSGPSLKDNVEDLKLNKDITTVSCLHNFHFLEDNGVPATYYITLDAGEVVIEEVYEGGKENEDYYWNLTKDRTLIAYIGTSPNLLSKWQGKVYFFNCPLPNDEVVKEIEAIEDFNVYLSTGGNVLGACLNFAKAFLGSSIVAFMGADFSFSYDHKFHGWNSKYDAKLGNVLRVKDVFGNSVLTWQSYHNFKGWFEYVTMTVPGIYYNCSEGGTLGAYPEGNIRTIIQSTLKDFLRQMNLNEPMEPQSKDPKVKEKTILF